MEILEYLNEHKEDILDDLFDLIKIPSVATEATGDKPYGEACARAVDYIIELAGRYGMTTKNFDYYAATATYGDTPEKLGILTHLDVVPEGNGWVFDPFFMTRHCGRIYGRGVADDKGCAVMSLWAIKAIKELGIPLKHGVRLVFGSGEEVGCKDLEYYMSKEKMPPYVFSPDAHFPIINTEKGRYCGEFSVVYDNCIDGPQLVRFNGGSTVNVVPQNCTATVRDISEETLQKALKKIKRNFNLTYKYNVKKTDINISFEESSSHASTPEKGVNAVTAMLTLINILPLDGQAFAFAKRINAMFPHGDYYGKALNAEVSDELSGKSTYSLDVLNIENGRIDGSFDSRTSLSANEENTVMPIKEKMDDAGIHLKNNTMMPAHHVDSEIDFIKILGNAYEKYTGLKSECIAMGGITYVHGIENAVAFGPLMQDCDAHIHGANEFMETDDIIRATAIFTQAVIDICS
ncbi:MAG: M20 family metallopeptidase [Ruminococcaceae bacterium]|nr:M20 family metallopeptidase [Oscillospiraceae bacterium]